MNALELFGQRAKKLEIDESIIFESYGIMLPPLAKDFLLAHELNVSLAQSEHFFHKKILNQGDITFPFHSIESILNSTKGMTDDEVNEKKILLIANNQFGVFLGTDGEWTDKIITKVSSVEGDFVVIANNITDFLKNTHDRLIDITDDEDEFVACLKELDYDEEEIGYELDDFRTYKNK